ncbi:MAG: MATE family efflux transporter [Alphaproteobacteria bacterium]|nr:MATE family efflux transporter [Alphaproteobacteria bacterium]
MQRPAFAYLIAQVRDLLRLAVPVIVARAGFMTMAFADILFVGRYGVGDLGYLTIGNAAISTFIVTSFGLLMGTLVMSASAFGAGNFAECGRVWRRSIPFSIFIGAGCAALSLLAEPFLRLIGQTPEIARQGARVAMILGLGAPFILAQMACIFFLEGIKRPMPGMLVMVVANIVNVALNWVFVFGHLGFHAMGAAGSAWATTLGRGVALSIIATYIWNMTDHEKFAIRVRLPAGMWRDWPAWRAQRRLGYAQGASNTVEASAFNAMALMAGLLGVVPLAAYGILFNLIAMAFMIPMGLAAATAVLVSAAHGAEDARGVAAAGWTGLGACIAMLSLLGVIYLLFPMQVAGLYSSVPELIAVSAPLIAMASYLIIADGVQAVMSNALRGLGDGWAPAAMHLLSYVVIMIPAGWYLTFSRLHGAMGLVEAILIASLISASMLTGRFFTFTRPSQ